MSSTQATLVIDDPVSLEVLGRLTAASNGSFLASLPDGRKVMYKPRRGERPLWDFPAGTLGRREVAACEVAQAMGVDAVPPTVWVESAPLGPGSVQLWIDAGEEGASLVDIVASNECPEGFLTSFAGVDAEGREVQLVHADNEQLALIALFDAVVNNADRKAGHLIVHAEGIAAIDHGVCFHEEPKLRTVLWGWAGHEIPPDGLERVVRISDSDHDIYRRVSELLSDAEAHAMYERVQGLASSGRFPLPSEEWPPLPWPLW